MEEKYLKKIWDKITKVKKEMGFSIGGIENFFNKLKLLWMCPNDYLEGKYREVTLFIISAVLGA